jgi:hypothetical protein
MPFHFAYVEYKYHLFFPQYLQMQNLQKSSINVYASLSLDLAEVTKRRRLLCLYRLTSNVHLILKWFSIWDGEFVY